MRRELFLAAFGVLALILAGTAGGEPALDQEEHELWTLVNEYRQANGVQRVGLNDQLMAAAEWMSEDMATEDRLSHTDSLGRGARQRMADFGYFVRQTMTGENLVAGVANAQEAFDLLKGSPKHNANMLSKYFWAIGIARAYDEASVHGWYWVMDLGGRGPVWFPENAAAPPSGMSPVPVATPAPTPAPTPTLAPSPTPSPVPLPAALPSTGTKPPSNSWTSCWPSARIEVLGRSVFCSA